MMIFTNRSKTTAEVLATLGERFRDYRMRMKMTRKDVAEAAGVGLTTLFRFETGKMSDMSMDTMVRLLRALDMADNWDQLLPYLPESPYLYNDKMKKIQRIRHPKK